MAHADEAESSKRSGDDKMKGIWKEASPAAHGPPSYRLFPEPSHIHHSIGLHNIFSADQPQSKLLMLPRGQDNPCSEVLTHGHLKGPIKAQTQFPIHAMKQLSCLELPAGEDVNANKNDGLNVETQMYNEYNVPGGSAPWFSSAPATVQQQASQVTLINDGGRQSSYFPSQAPAPMEGKMDEFADIMAVQQAYLCALHDPDQITPLELIHQSPDALKNHYAHDILLMSQSTNSVTREPQRIASSSQLQHSGQDNINHSSSVQQRMSSIVDNTFSIIGIKGKIAGFCANPQGSRLIQHALETATQGEIIMVYKEVIPYARMLTIDAFANYAIQKLLEHGPQIYKRKFMGHLIGHVLPLSLHTYGCRVIEKAFEVGDLDLKIQMADEYNGKVLKCARDQHANHVIQKCMECVPAQHVQFIFRSFCGKAKEFSTIPYGCHVIQKVLAFCNNLEIYHTLVSEIVEIVLKLASDPFGNYVLQHVVEHGGPVERSMIVRKFAGCVVSLSYQKFASNVIEKCLTFGSFQDRQLIINEILTAGDGQLPDMMCHVYANFVIQKLVATAEEPQLRVVLAVAQRNAGTITGFQHGRHVLAHIQRVLADRARGFPSVPVANPPLQPPRGQSNQSIHPHGC